MKNIEVIGMPMKYGCFVEGADLSYEYLKDTFEKVFNIKCNNVVNTELENVEIHKEDKKIKYLEPVMELSNRLYRKVSTSLEEDNFPIVVGGDHSTCIGSISAVLDYYKGDVSVIYIDKHADIHTEKTTPSGNIHGMPLSICIGRCDNRFNIGNYKLNKNNLFFIGLSNYEIEEMNYIQESNIYHLLESEVEKRNALDIVEDIVKRINTKYVHISLDLDSLKDEEFHAVNVAVENIYNDDKGMNLDKLKDILKLLLQKLNVCSMDVVEYNPLLDNGECKKKVEEILVEVKNNRR